jgi:hypothetical protein
MNDNVPNRLRARGINLSSWLHQIIRASVCVCRQPTLKKKVTVSVSPLNFLFFVPSSVSNAYLAARIHVFKIWYWKVQKLTHWTVFQAIFSEDIKMSRESSSGSEGHDAPSPSLLNNLRQFRFQKKSALKVDTTQANGVVSNGTLSK